MAAVTFGGLVSGLDTSSLIEKLVSAERSNARLLTTKQSNLSAQRSIVDRLSSAVAALGTAARGLDLDSELRPRAATVSDSRMNVAVSSSAAATAHEVRVKQLASNQVTQSNTYASDTAGIAGTGSLAITVGTETKNISYDSTDTLSTIASKITNANAGVSASVLFDGSTYRLMVASKESGTAKAATFVDSGSGLGLSSPANIKVPARDAIVSIDGVDVTRSTNVISDALAGVTMTLNSVHQDSEANGKLSVGLDNKALTEKVKTLVTNYNAVNTQLQVQLSYTGTTKGENTLFGDSTLRQLQMALDRQMSTEYGGTNLGALGMTRDKTGVITLDEAKLTAAVAADPDIASKLFVTGGFATTLASLADSYTTSGTGFFAAKSEAITARSKALQQQIDRIDLGADKLQSRLERQFAALEEAMAKLQSQSAFLSRTL